MPHVYPAAGSGIATDGGEEAVPTFDGRPPEGELSGTRMNSAVGL